MGIEIEQNLEDAITRDGGWRSRKFWMTVIAMALIFVSGALGGYFVVVETALSIVVGGILGCLGLFLGANVSTKYAATGLAKVKAKGEDNGSR